MGFLGLDSLRFTLVLLKAGNYSLCTLTSDTDGWTIEIDDASTNLGVLTTEEDPISKNPRPVLSETDFWTFNMSSNLEVEVLSICSLATNSKPNLVVILFLNA